MLERLKKVPAGIKKLHKRRRPLSQVPVIDENKFLFIGGLHRSGTSILHRLLCEHPLTSGFHDTGVAEDEGQHLQTVFKTAHEFGGAGEFAFHLDAHLTEDSALINQDNKALLLREWGAYYDLRKPVLLEKSPPNMIRSRFLRQMLKNSSFIFIVRHPIAVSMATEKWTKNTIIERLLHWHTAYSIMLDDMRSVPDCLVIRYEDLVRAPVEYLDQVCDFAGIHRFCPKEKVADHNQKYFLDWQQRYQSELATLKAVLPENNAVLEHFGYSLEAPYVNDI